MKKLLNYSVVLFVLTIVLLLIIPMPPALVDVAIILNISLSMMILVITMTIREPLEFAIFPSLLLITTLFRLGINVSTTRNILSRGGSSGHVIKAGRYYHLPDHCTHAVHCYHQGRGARGRGGRQV